MSQFDLPRINFHGTALLDTATANNGNYEPSLTMFDQNESEPFLPPRCYLPQNYTYQPPPNVQILKDANGNYYVPIAVITADNYRLWAITPLGSFLPDSDYWTLYTYLQLTGNNPGYWNYFGDLSMSLINTQVTGITLSQKEGGVITYTPQNQTGCPTDLAALFGAELSFNSDYFTEGSRTSAYLCDADSIGQMCTQIFCGTAGLYKTDAQGKQITFFSGTPVKSTARWMNLNKVLNYSDRSIIPMGGSACFYAMIALNGESDLSNMMLQNTGKQASALFLKLQIHEVYEVRNPDYKKVPTKSIMDMFGNQSGVPKNPAVVAVSGSITPWYDEDMQTASVSRLMKNNSAITIDTSAIPHPVTKSGNKLSVASAVFLAPIQFLHTPSLNLISLDIINSINEYGTNPATLAVYAGNNDIPPFQDFLTYNYGTFTLMFDPDDGSTPQTIGSFDYDANYNMQQLLATGGVIDFIVPPGSDFTKGTFNIMLNNKPVFSEDNFYITSDQMGNYAQQNQTGNNYMSDGLPMIPCTLRVFYRGMNVSENSPATVTMQAIYMRTQSITNTPNIPIYDGMPMTFPVNVDGCMTYAFVDAQSQLWDGAMPNLFQFAMNTSLVVLRTLSSDPDLDIYISGNTPITWDVVYNNVFRLFKVLYPVMNAVIPFTEPNWSNPFILNKMLTLIDNSNWNQPLYMPVTRDLSAQQQQLLRIWANQKINPASNT